MIEYAWSFLVAVLISMAVGYGLCLFRWQHEIAAGRKARSLAREAVTPADYNPADFTRKRLKVTFRFPAWPVPDPSIPYVMAEDEAGSGVAVAIFGPDSPAARADAARMVGLWNDSLNAGH